MQFTVNGKERSSAVRLSIADYLRSIGANPLAVAAEVNGEVVKRERFEETFISDGDRLEIVRMMGGGC